MLQRIQSLWLLIASACSFLTIKYSFYSGNKLLKADPSQPVSPNFQYLTSGSSVLILILTIAVVCMALIDIFLYKNRKLQMRIALGAILLSLLNIFLFYRETKSFVQGNYDLSAIFSLAVPVFLILAASGIYKDEKLVKSMDKLR